MNNGLVFWFDPYEVTSYAGGPTRFVIPWEVVRPWIRDDGPLASSVPGGR